MSCFLLHKLSGKQSVFRPSKTKSRPIIPIWVRLVYALATLENQILWMNMFKLKSLAILFIALGQFQLYGQVKKLDQNALDFWVGEWNLTWENPDGSIAEGYNQISKTLDGKVIQENFEDPSSGFKGTSISVYNPKLEQWFQSWADNNGGFFSFYGELNGENPVFSTTAQNVDGHSVVRRMVFKDITRDNFEWDWEVSSDGGLKWELKWRIHYTRKDN